MSVEITPKGATVPIRVLMYDGATAKTGLTVNVSIERISDGKYWDGAAWQGTYQALAMTELSGDAHLAGVYEYQFVTPTTAGRFDWRVTYTGGIDRAFAGRISTEALQDVLDKFTDALVELTGVPSKTPTLEQAIMLMFMHLRNGTSFGGVAPDEQFKIRNDAGVVIAKADSSDDGSTFALAKLVNGP